MIANVWMQRQRIARANATIEELDWDIKLLNIDEAYLESQTLCDQRVFGYDQRNLQRPDELGKRSSSNIRYERNSVSR